VATEIEGSGLIVKLERTSSICCQDKAKEEDPRWCGVELFGVLGVLGMLDVLGERGMDHTEMGWREGPVVFARLLVHNEGPADVGLVEVVAGLLGVNCSCHEW
jgi:hypothetical protein